MANWDSLASNQLVDGDAIADAISLGYLALRPGQVEPSGNICLTSSQLYQLLEIQNLPLPASMPVKADIVPYNSVLSVHQTQQAAPLLYVDVNMVLRRNGVSIREEYADYNEQISVSGGDLIEVEVFGFDNPQAGVIAPSKRLVVLENGIEIFRQSNASPGLGQNIIWSKRILPNATYTITSTGQSYQDSYFYFTNWSGEDLYYSFDDFSFYYLLSGAAVDLLAPFIASGGTAGNEFYFASYITQPGLYNIYKINEGSVYFDKTTAPSYLFDVYANTEPSGNADGMTLMMERGITGINVYK